MHFSVQRYNVRNLASISLKITSRLDHSFHIRLLSSHTDIGMILKIIVKLKYDLLSLLCLIYPIIHLDHCIIE